MALPLQPQTETLTRGVLRGVTVLVLAALAFQAVGPDSRFVLRSDGDVRVGQKVVTEAVVRRADRLERRQQHKPIPASRVMARVRVVPPSMPVTGIREASPPVCFMLPAFVTDLPPPATLL